MVRRLMYMVLALMVVLSFPAQAVRAQDTVGGALVVLSGGGGSTGSQSLVPPAGAITAAQAEAAVTKYFTPPEGATVNSTYLASFPPGDRPVWNVSWFVASSGPTGGGVEEGMFASVDAMTGRIVNFNRQSPAGAVPSAQTYSYRQAQVKAEQAMAELAPDAAGQVELAPAAAGRYGPLANYGKQA